MTLICFGCTWNVWSLWVNRNEVLYWIGKTPWSELEKQKKQKAKALRVLWICGTGSQAGWVELWKGKHREGPDLQGTGGSCKITLQGSHGKAWVGNWPEWNVWSQEAWEKGEPSTTVGHRKTGIFLEVSLIPEGWGWKGPTIPFSERPCFVNEAVEGQKMA